MCGPFPWASSYTFCAYASGMDCDPFPNLDLSCLTPRQREVVEMHYCHCLTFGQIALFTGSNYEAVKKVHKRALIKLRPQCGL